MDDLYFWSKPASSDFNVHLVRKPRLSRNVSHPSVYSSVLYSTHGTFAEVIPLMIEIRSHFKMKQHDRVWPSCQIEKNKNMSRPKEAGDYLSLQNKRNKLKSNSGK